MLDAYTIKKIAPRILIGIILINLSIYIVTAASEMTRLVANGAGSLITAPVAEINNFSVGESGSFTTGVLPVAIFSALIVKKVAQVSTRQGDDRSPLRTFTSDFFRKDPDGTQLSRFGEISHWLVFVIIIPIALIFLAILITLVFRQGLLILLAVTAPIAFAMYLLPSTEKYFKKWWELFIKTLLVYPIIVIIFAVADFLASLIFNSNPGSLVAIIAGMITLFAPLILIPFAFKFAGGAIGAIYGAVSSGGAKLGKGGLLKRQQDFARQRVGDKFTQARYEAYNQLMDRGSLAGLTERQRRSARRTAGLVGGRNIQARISEINKRQGESMFAQIATGPDSLIRAYTVDKAWADQHGVENEDWKVDDNGVRQYRTLGGAWVSESDVLASRRALGTNNMAAFQTGLTYEMQKANTQEEQDRVISQYGRAARSFGLSGAQTGEVWIGSAFAKQNENRQWKQYGWKGDRTDTEGNFLPQLNGLGLMQEIDEKQGNYPMLMQNADTWTAMRSSANEAARIRSSLKRNADAGLLTPDEQKQYDGANETLLRADRIARGFESGGYTLPGEKDGSPISMGGGVSGGPGRTQEEAKNFLQDIKNLRSTPEIGPAMGPQIAIPRSDRGIEPPPSVSKK